MSYNKIHLSEKHWRQNMAKYAAFHQAWWPVTTKLIVLTSVHLKRHTFTLTQKPVISLYCPPSDKFILPPHCTVPVQSTGKKTDITRFSVKSRSSENLLHQVTRWSEQFEFLLAKQTAQVNRLCPDCACICERKPTQCVWLRFGDPGSRKTSKFHLFFQLRVFQRSFSATEQHPSSMIPENTHETIMRQCGSWVEMCFLVCYWAFT